MSFGEWAVSHEFTSALLGWKLAWTSYNIIININQTRSQDVISIQIPIWHKFWNPAWVNSRQICAIFLAKFIRRIIIGKNVILRAIISRQQVAFVLKRVKHPVKIVVFEWGTFEIDRFGHGMNTLARWIYGSKILPDLIWFSDRKFWNLSLNFAGIGLKFKATVCFPVILRFWCSHIGTHGFSFFKQDTNRNQLLNRYLFSKAARKG